MNKISLKFVSLCPIDNIPALVQIMAWRRPGNKPLSEPMMASLLMHICVTRPQWVNQTYLKITSLLWNGHILFMFPAFYFHSQLCHIVPWELGVIWPPVERWDVTSIAIFISHIACMPWLLWKITHIVHKSRILPEMALQRWDNFNVKTVFPGILFPIEDWF